MVSSESAIMFAQLVFVVGLIEIFCHTVSLRRPETWQAAANESDSAAIVMMSVIEVLGSGS